MPNTSFGRPDPRLMPMPALGTPDMPLPVPANMVPTEVPQLPPPTSGAFVMPEIAPQSMADTINFRSLYNQMSPELGGMVDSLPRPNPIRDALLTWVDQSRAMQGQMPIPRLFDPAAEYRSNLAKIEMLKDLAQIQNIGEQAGANNADRYGRIAESYRRERMAPYDQRTSFYEGEMQRTGALENVADEAAKRADMRRADELQPYAIGEKKANIYQSTQSGNASGAQAERTRFNLGVDREKAPYEIDTAKYGSEIKQAEAQYAEPLSRGNAEKAVAEGEIAKWKAEDPKNRASGNNSGKTPQQVFDESIARGQGSQVAKINYDVSALESTLRQNAEADSDEELSYIDSEGQVVTSTKEELTKELAYRKGQVEAIKRQRGQSETNPQSAPSTVPGTESWRNYVQ